MALEFTQRITVGYLQAFDVLGHPPEAQMPYLVAEAAREDLTQYLLRGGVEWHRDCSTSRIGCLRTWRINRHADYDDETGVCTYTLIYPIGERKTVRLQPDTIWDVVTHGNATISSFEAEEPRIRLMVAKSDLSREELLQMDYADWSLLQGARLNFLKPVRPLRRPDPGPDAFGGGLSFWPGPTCSAFLRPTA